MSGVPLVPATVAKGRTLGTMPKASEVLRNCEKIMPLPQDRRFVIARLSRVTAIPPQERFNHDLGHMSDIFKVTR